MRGHAGVLGRSPTRAATADSVSKMGPSPPQEAVVGIRPPHEVPWHAMADVNQVLKELDTDMERGLTTEEAARRLQM